MVVLAASAHRRVKKTKDVWRDAVDEDDDVMRLMIIQLRFRFRRLDTVRKVELLLA